MTTSPWPVSWGRTGFTSVAAGCQQVENRIRIDAVSDGEAGEVFSGWDEYEAVLAAAQAAGLFVGYSCATAAQVARANQLAGVAYVGSGPVFPTISKADADPALGVAGLAALVAQSLPSGRGDRGT